METMEIRKEIVGQTENFEALRKTIRHNPKRIHSETLRYIGDKIEGMMEEYLWETPKKHGIETKLESELREFAIELIKRKDCSIDQILYLIYDESPV